MAEPELETEKNPDQVGDGQIGDVQIEDPKSKKKATIRKETKPRSIVWKHFLQIKDAKGKLIEAKCIYCKKVWAADSKTCGTKNLKNHMLACIQNPCFKKPGQTQFQISNWVKNDKGESVLTQPTCWKFNEANVRKGLAEMIVMDEQPFSIVEKVGFKHFISTALPPTFVPPSRRTITRDCLELYTQTMANMKSIFKDTKQRISITTDTWTSNQRISYMCITSHWIDQQWELHKRVLSFCPVESHKGADIGEAIEKCLIEWGIDKLFCVTVDNASANDNVIKSLKVVLKNWGTSILDGEYLHMRCVAHIVNLVVQDGLKEILDAETAVRAAVRYVRQSPARLKKFKECAEREKIESKKGLCFDVQTRWNSTYLMLNVAEKYQRAFERYERQDPQFEKELKGASTRVPTENDWESVRRMVKFLEYFYEKTVRVSGSLYVTAHTFLPEISAINSVLQDLKCSSDIELSLMANRMKKKFDKYWGQPEEMNKVIFIAVLLDPTKKLDFLRFVLTEMHGEEKVKIIENMVKDATCKMFNEYKICNELPQAEKHKKSSASEKLGSVSIASSDEIDYEQQGMASLMHRFKRFKNESGFAIEKTELDKYLGEDVEDVPSLDILQWWKFNQPRFPTLAQMARDVLAVPISTVASESTFSTGGRVLDDFRSSLTPKMVQALICTQDWIRPRTKSIVIEEDYDVLEKIETDLAVSDD